MQKYFIKSTFKMIMINITMPAWSFSENLIAKVFIFAMVPEKPDSYETF